MPWEKQYNADEMIGRAMHAFWARGFEGTSIADLVSTTGINRGSLYSAFDGKRSLFIETLRYYDQNYRQKFLAQLAAQHGAKDAILSAFEAAADNRAGCLIVNTAMELAPHDSEIAELVHESLGHVEEFFTDAITRAQADGTVAGTLDAAQTAKALMGMFIGLRVLARSNMDRDALKAITSQAEAILSG